MGLKKVLETVINNPPLTLTNGVGGEKIDIDTLQGYSKQNVYSGKNLLNSTLSTTTQNGVTYTVNKDGTIKTSGTSNASGGVALVSSIELPKGTYKIIGCPSGGATNKYYIAVRKDARVDDLGNGGTFTLSEDGLVTININYNASGLVANETFKPMLVDATKYPNVTYNDYEPYVGGIPAPNPQYPQEIKSCGDSLNLIDKESSASSIAGYKLPQTLPSGTYTISIDKVSTANGFRLSKTTSTASDSIATATKQTINGRDYLTLTTTFEANYINLSGSEPLNNIMLNSGSTPLPYAPYGNIVQFRENGKNLFVPTLETTSLNGVTCTKNNDGTYTLNGTCSATTGFNLGYINLKANTTYYISGCPSGGSDSKYKFDGIANYKTVFKDIGNGTYINSLNTDRYTQVRIVCYAPTVFNNLVFKPMISINEVTYNDYQPYQTPDIINLPLSAPLRSVGDIKDEIITDEDGVKKIVRRIGSVDLGTRTYTYDSNNKYYQTQISGKAVGETNLLTSRYTVARNTGVLQDYQICGRYNNAYIYIKDSSVADANALKTSLNGVELIYELATPTIEPLTEEQLAELDKLVSFEDVTYFSVDSGLLTLKYYAYKNVFWEEPKTNWQSTDYINYIDYERIKDNVIYIGGMARSLYAKIPSEIEMPSKQSYSAIPYASDWNAIENNIDNINRGTVKMDIGTTKVFQSNGFFINYEELNRLEGATDMLYDALKIGYDLLPKLSYRLGSPKFKF